MDGKLTVGEILKPQGIRGELKVKPLVDDPADFKRYGKAYIDGKPHKILGARINGGEVYLFLNGIADRTAAEDYRGKFLLVDRADVPPLQEGRYYIVDVLGCEVFTDGGKSLGKVADITTGGGGDVYTVIGEDERIIFPLLNDLLIDMDVKNKRMTVKDAKLKEVSLVEKISKNH